MLGDDQIEEDPYRNLDQQTHNEEAEQLENGDLDEIDKPSTTSQ